MRYWGPSWRVGKYVLHDAGFAEEMGRSRDQATRGAQGQTGYQGELIMDVYCSMCGGRSTEYCTHPDRVGTGIWAARAMLLSFPGLAVTDGEG